jgi:hypothetical protein
MWHLWGLDDKTEPPLQPSHHTQSTAKQQMCRTDLCPRGRFRLHGNPRACSDHLRRRLRGAHSTDCSLKSHYSLAVASVGLPDKAPAVDQLRDSKVWMGNPTTPHPTANCVPPRHAWSCHMQPGAQSAQPDTALHSKPPAHLQADEHARCCTLDPSPTTRPHGLPSL